MGLAFLLLLAAAPAQDPPRAALGAWDGGEAVPAGETRASFKGEAALSNGRLRAVATPGKGALDLYSLGTGEPVHRARLALPPGPVALVENARGAVALEAGGTRFRLKRGEIFVECQAAPEGARLRVECPSRFAVLPDFFADDILIDARRFPGESAELPSENFVLHLPGGGDAIVMTVFENREQEVRVALTGRGDERRIEASEVVFGKGRKIWVAVLEGAGFWHSAEVGAADAKKVTPLGWTMPFVAQWRVDFTRKDDLTDSWDMLLPEKEGGGFYKPSWLAEDGKLTEASRTASGEVDGEAYKVGGSASQRLGPERKRWTTVLGSFQYPCWTDLERKGWLQPLEHAKLAFRGPVVVYPINRLPETPVDRFLPVDVLRQTLGVGPCQYILDVEGQKAEHVGRATCHVRTELTKIWTAGRQKERRKEVENYVQDALDFVVHIRKRILAYVEFGKETLAWLEARRATQPELKAFLDDMEAVVREIDQRVKVRVDTTSKNKLLQEVVARLLARGEEPTPPALAAELNRDFLKTLAGYEGADWKERLKKDYFDGLTHIGGQQDELVGECRWVVKALRQKAGLAMASDPKAAPAAAELRARAQKILRGGAAYEGARH